jgi:uncharacterized protein
MSEYASIKKEVLTKLEANLPEIRERFGIETIGIFGSVSREEDTAESDVDVLYAFKTGGVPLREFFAFKQYLEDLFGRTVDLVPVRWLAPSLRPYIERDMILFEANKAEA